MNRSEMYPFMNSDLPVEERINDLVSRLTLEEKISLLPTQQVAIPRLGIPKYSVGAEGAHGVAWLGVATVFPQPIGLACTWDRELLKKIGEIIGKEARVYYERANREHGLTIWAPTVNLVRDIRWGRTEETYGEDPYLTGELAGAYVKGLQGDHPFYLLAAATPKHFFANNNESYRGSFSASIDPRNIMEYYLNSFRPLIEKARANCIMTAYNAVNGIPCMLHPLINEVVKGKWGLEGFVVLDAADFSQTVTMHHYFETHAETLAYGLKAGVDCFTDDPELVIKSAHEALEKGLITEEDIDRAIKNTLKVRFRLGQFDPDELNPYAKVSEDTLCYPEHTKVANIAAKESIVLLKNDKNTLPLKKEKIRKIAVIGPLADVVYTDHYSGTLPYTVTPLAAIKSKLPNCEVVYEEGYDKICLKSVKDGRYLSLKSEDGNILLDNVFNDPNSTFYHIDWGWGNHSFRSCFNNKYLTAADNGLVTATSDQVRGWFVKELFNMVKMGLNTFILQTWNKRYISHENFGRDSMVHTEYPQIATTFAMEKIESGIQRAAKAAAEADVAIVFLGNNPFVNGKEDVDRPDITLPAYQEELLKSVYKVNPNTVLVLISSYPIAINWAEENIPAIIYSSHGGQEMGNAITDVLFGDYSPAGRLNLTWYKDTSQMPSIFDYDIIRGKRTYMYFDGQPLYPFGHGLTYTRFEYDNLNISTKTCSIGQHIKITVDIKNVGEYESDEVVQLYIKANSSKVKRPLKQLRGFERIHLRPGEAKKVEFTLTPQDFEFWDVRREKFSIEKGYYTIMIGTSSEDIRLSSQIYIEGEDIPPRDITKKVKAYNYDDCHNVIIHQLKDGDMGVMPKNKEGWIEFSDCDFPDDVNKFECEVIFGTSESKVIIYKDFLDGDILGTIKSKDHNVLVKECNILPVVGIHNIYIKLIGDVAIKWFRFF